MAKKNITQENAAIIAANLVKTTAETTATALNIQYIQKDILEIKQSIKDMVDKDAQYVLKEDFMFWRNILVGTMIVTIFLSIVLKFIQK